MEIYIIMYRLNCISPYQSLPYRFSTYEAAEDFAIANFNNGYDEDSFYIDKLIYDGYKHKYVFWGET